MKFGYVILYVKDVKFALDFYEKAFGLKRGFVTESGHYAEMVTGETKLCFADAQHAKPEGLAFHPHGKDMPSAPIEIAFVTDDLASSYKKAIDAGCKSILEPTQKPWGQGVSYVRDVNGFLVEICTPVGD